MITRVNASDFLELSKPGICFLALVMASFGFFLGCRGFVPSTPFFGMLTGLALLGASSGALNQLLEKEIDSKMWRTINRPLPAGRISTTVALVFGLVTLVAGILSLAVFVNKLTAFLGAFTVLSYLAIYTPSKRYTSLSTLLGAVPGALPPLMGWTAARGEINAEGLLLFSILFLWQIPHFLAIAWMYREDYARAGLPILSVVDSDGILMAKHVLLYSMALMPITLIPFTWGMAGITYLTGAAVLGMLFIVFGIYLALYRSHETAKRLFLASILYLPALGFLMVWDRTF